MEKLENGNYTHAGYEVVKAGRKWDINGFMAKNLTEAEQHINEIVEAEKEDPAKAESRKKYQRNRWKNRTEEQKDGYREYRKERWNNRTEEEKAKDREYRRQRYHRLKSVTVEEQEREAKASLSFWLNYLHSIGRQPRS